MDILESCLHAVKTKAARLESKLFLILKNTRYSHKKTDVCFGGYLFEQLMKVKLHTTPF